MHFGNDLQHHLLSTSNLINVLFELILSHLAKSIKPILVIDRKWPTDQILTPQEDLQQAEHGLLLFSTLETRLSQNKNCRLNHLDSIKVFFSKSVNQVQHLHHQVAGMQIT